MVEIDINIRIGLACQDSLFDITGGRQFHLEYSY